jgi:threonine dehydrogenase-like Zn-dependent dehydrogenase
MVSSGTELRMLSGHASFPMIPGYSSVGEIVEIGAKVRGYRVGDLVSGRSCPRFVPGINAACGGHMSGQVFPATGEDRCVLLPPGADPLDFVATEISSISLRGVDAAAPQPGETAIVLGQGLIGAFSAAWLHARGCHVVVADREERRLARARAWSGGTVATVNIGEPDAVDRLLALVNGGADIIVESSGTIPGVQTAYGLIRATPRSAPGSPYYRGEPIATHAGQWPRLVFQASYTQEVTIHPHGFYPGEGVTIITPADRSLEDRQKAMKAIWKGAIKSKDFIDRIAKCENAPEAYRGLRDDKDANFSLVFDWTGR